MTKKGKVRWEEWGAFHVISSKFEGFVDREIKNLRA